MFDPDFKDKLVLQDLKSCHDSLVQDYKKVKSKKGRAPSIFSTDREEDMDIILQHIAAFKIVMRYYGWNK